MTAGVYVEKYGATSVHTMYSLFSFWVVGLQKEQTYSTVTNSESKQRFDYGQAAIFECIGIWGSLWAHKAPLVREIWNGEIIWSA